MGLFDILDNKEFSDKLRQMADKAKDVAQDWGKSAQELSKKAPGGTAGLVGAGILGAVLGGMLPKGAVRTVGAAGLGAVAWSFYQKWAAQNAAAQAAQGAGAQGADAMPHIAMDDPAARLLVQAMIFAAKADGHIDATEDQRITAMLAQLYPGQDTTTLKQQMMTELPDPNALARNVSSPEQGEDVYRLSCLVTDIDTPAERAYLMALAQALNIEDTRRTALEQEAEAAKAKL